MEVFAARHSEQVDFRFEWIIFFETSGMFDSKKNRNKSIKIGNLFWFLFAISIGSVFLMPQDCYTLNTEEIFFSKMGPPGSVLVT